MKNIGETRWRRKSIRHKNHDYVGDGMYFVTICAREKQHLFGQMKDGSMQLNEMEKIVEEELLRTATLRSNVTLYMYVVRPTLFQEIKKIDDGGGWARKAPTTQRTFTKPLAQSLGSIIGAFKSAATKRINALEPNGSGTWWQRNFYEPACRQAGISFAIPTICVASNGTFVTIRNIGNGRSEEHTSE